MEKETASSNFVSVNFRLAPVQVHQLIMLGIIYGNRTRAFTVALDRLYQAELATNPAFAELVADSSATPDTPPPDNPDANDA
jgi:hypothetical protein